MRGIWVVEMTNELLRELLVQMVFGFPAGVVSLSLSSLGIWKKKIALLILGCVLVFPMAAYLGATENWSISLVGFLHLVAAYAVKRQRHQLAWTLLIPAALITLFMLFITIYAALHHQFLFTNDL